MRNGLLTLALLGSLSSSAYTLKITGLVSHSHGADAMSGALVGVCKHGVKLHAVESNAFGRYNVKLENGADYTFRFSAPGFVTKCFGVDTHGLEWEGETNVKELFVEMTMIETIPGIELDF